MKGYLKSTANLKSKINTVGNLVGKITQPKNNNNIDNLKIRIGTNNNIPLCSLKGYTNIILPNSAVISDCYTINVTFAYNMATYHTIPVVACGSGELNINGGFGIFVDSYYNTSHQIHIGYREMNSDSEFVNYDKCLQLSTDFSNTVITVTFVYDGNIARIYINDILISEKIANIYNTDRDLQIGNWKDQGNNTPTDIDLYDFRIYDKALTNTDIMKLHQNLKKIYDYSQFAPFENDNKYYCADYIVMEANAKIDTGYIPNSNTTVEIGIMPLDTTGAAIISAGNSYRLFNYQSQIYFDLIDDQSNHRLYGSSFAPENYVELKVSNRQVIRNNIVVLSGEPVEYFECTSSLVLGGYVASYVKYLRIYDNDVLVRDFVPIADNNYIGCLYDRVTQQVYNGVDGAIGAVLSKKIN